MAITFTLPYEKVMHVWPSLNEETERLLHKKRYHFYTHSFYMYEEPQTVDELMVQLNNNEEWIEKFRYLRERDAYIDMLAAPSYMNHSIKVGFWARFPEEKWETEFLLRFGVYR